MEHDRTTGHIDCSPEARAEILAALRRQEETNRIMNGDSRPLTAAEMAEVMEVIRLNYEACRKNEIDRVAEKLIRSANEKLEDSDES